MRIMAVLLFLISMVNAEGWLHKSTPNTMSSHISYFITTDKRDGMLLELSYNLNAFLLGLKQTDSYRLDRAEITPFIGYIIHDFEFNLGYGESSLYTGSTVDTDPYFNYAIRYHPWNIIHIGLEQHIYERSDAENFFIFSLGITYTTDWKSGF